MNIYSAITLIAILLMTTIFVNGKNIPDDGPNFARNRQKRYLGAIDFSNVFGKILANQIVKNTDRPPFRTKQKMEPVLA